MLKALEAGHDDTVLVLNGSGGVGTVAIQLARVFGAQVVSTGSEKIRAADACRLSMGGHAAGEIAVTV